jgi:opacity protein-like surface antigen
MVGPSPGPPPRLYRIWAGAYGGAQVGEDWHAADFRGVTSDAIQTAIRQDGVLNALSGSLPGMPHLPQVNSNGPSYGGFLGYNWQIDDVVFGAELNVNRSQFHQSAFSTVNRSYIVTTANGNVYAPTTVSLTSAGTIDMSTYATVRGRLGWAMGSFLPYWVAGVAFAQINSTRFVDISYFGVDVTPSNCTPPVTPACVNVGGNYPFSNVIHGKYILGFDTALGLDYMLTRNVFLRGEVEYLQLGTPNDIRVSTVSARTAVGLRF